MMSLQYKSGPFSKVYTPLNIVDEYHANDNVSQAITCLKAEESKDNDLSGVLGTGQVSALKLNMYST
jgi:hypothetical protein